jgi:hypothetical protein
MAKHIFASVEAWTKQNAAVGPYSPVKGPRSIQFCGGPLAFAREHQVDASNFDTSDVGVVVELKDAAGRAWYARSTSARGLIFAFRDPTPEEIEDEIDLSDMRTGVNVERVRLDACRIVAREMSKLADGMRTEQCPSRQRRRAVKRRMLALTTLQRNLLSLRDVNARALREEMKALGLPLPRRDYWGVGA